MNKLLRKVSNDKMIIFGCFMLSVTLWFSSQLSKTIISSIEFSAKFHSSKNMTLASEPPSNIIIDAEGTGWSLLFSELNNHIAWNLYLPNNKEIIYSENDIIKNIYNDFNVENIIISNVRPSHIFIKQDSLIYKEVPIKANINTFPMEGYTVQSDYLITPSQVVLIGPSEMLSKIDNWSVGNIQLKQTDNQLNIQKTIQLSSGNDLLKLEPKIVEITSSFEELTEKTINIQIHVDTTGAQIDRIFPKEIMVKIRVGISKFHQINASDFELGLDIDSVNESNIYIVTVRESPSDIEIIDLTPSYVEIYFKDN